jgi:eukaryotic-like serine/threonine-protein kinase
VEGVAWVHPCSSRRLGQLIQGVQEPGHIERLVAGRVRPFGQHPLDERGGRRDFLKLLDFGLVKSLDGDPTATPGGAGRIQGTPQYMAPEQVQNAPGVDHRCDLYALGCVAYELLTGHPLFEVEDVNGMLAAQVRNPVVPPSRHRPDLPDDLERVVLRLLAKDPADRYPDAASVALALASCANAGTWDDSSSARWWRDFEAEMADPPAS